MANQVIVTNTGNVQVALTPPPNVQVQISRAAIGTVSNVPTANFANYAANVTSSSQPNITSLGTLSNLSVSGNTTLNNLVVTGNLSVGNLIANSANYANFAGVANTANTVAGANVTGVVANATFATSAGTSNSATVANSANSVTLANVSGAGNIASINLDGNVANLLTGNGTFVAIPTVSANANYANFAGTAYNVSGANVTGEVANANYASYANLASTANLATFATTANSVAGANVSGEVANANYASYANIANTANSVALANVVGIGNIANINLDGSSSNVLFGNGVFAPESTSIANANYANFAGNLINGTSNISIPTANANILFSTAGNANVVDIQAIGTFNVKPPAQGPLSAIRIDTYGRSGNTGAQRIASFRYRGNATTPLSVQANDLTMELLTVGYNGSNVQTNSIASFNAIVANSYITNDANIPLGWQLRVNDTNGNINNQSRIHNFYSNGNVVLNQSLDVPGNIYAYNGNITANTGVFVGNGSGLTNLTGANVTGTVANATYAANAGYAVDSGTAAVANSVAGANVSGQVANALVAGTVYTNAQPNITSTGNLISLNVVDSANVTGTIQQLAPNTITITTNSTNNTAYDLTTIYGETSNIAESGQRAIIRSRGNVSTPATVAVSDVGSRDRVYFYNGTTNALGFATSVTLSNLNSNSNAYSTGATYSVSVGAPSGDQGNANALSAFNTMSFNQNGQLLLIPGSTSTVASGLLMYSYGQNTNLAQSQGITFSKARGNRDANLSVNQGDVIGRLVFQGYNGNSFVTNRLPIIRSTVDSTYVANAANIPAGLQMITCDSNTSYTHNFYANGATVLSGNLNTMGGSFNVTKTTAGATSLNFTGDKTTNSTFSLSEAQFSVTMSNVDCTTGFSPFRFQQYAPTNNQFGTMYLYRARGDDYFTQTPVVAGDDVIRITASVNSNNAYAQVGYFSAQVSYNDNAGNVAGLTTISAVGSGATGYTYSSINLDANTTSANNIGANNVAINNGSNNFMKLSSYTEAALGAITGQIGWMAAVTDSASGGNPNGMIAFWDTTNSRWSYIHDNSAV